MGSVLPKCEQDVGGEADRRADLQQDPPQGVLGHAARRVLAGHAEREDPREAQRDAEHRGCAEARAEEGGAADGDQQDYDPGDEAAHGGGRLADAVPASARSGTASARARERAWHERAAAAAARRGDADNDVVDARAGGDQREGAAPVAAIGAELAPRRSCRPRWRSRRRAAARRGVYLVPAGARAPTISNADHRRLGRESRRESSRRSLRCRKQRGVDRRRLLRCEARRRAERRRHDGGHCAPPCTSRRHGGQRAPSDPRAGPASRAALRRCPMVNGIRSGDPRRDRAGRRNRSGRSSRRTWRASRVRRELHAARASSRWSRLRGRV